MENSVFNTTGTQNNKESEGLTMEQELSRCMVLRDDGYNILTGMKEHMDLLKIANSNLGIMWYVSDSIENRNYWIIAKESNQWELINTDIINRKADVMFVKDGALVRKLVEFDRVENELKMKYLIENEIKEIVKLKLTRTGLWYDWEEKSITTYLKNYYTEAEREEILECVERFKKLELCLDIDFYELMERAMEDLEDEGYGYYYVEEVDGRTFKVVYKTLEERIRAYRVAKMVYYAYSLDYEAMNAELPEDEKYIMDMYIETNLPNSLEEELEAENE